MVEPPLVRALDLRRVSSETARRHAEQQRQSLEKRAFRLADVREGTPVDRVLRLELACLASSAVLTSLGTASLLGERRRTKFRILGNQGSRLLFHEWHWLGVWARAVEIGWRVCGHVGR